MEKYIWIFLIIALLAGCGSKPDFEGAIIEVKENSIVVGEDDVDPEASYPTYEVLIDQNTEIDEPIDALSDEKVQIWVSGNGVEVDGKLAEKIKIESDQ
ncbi:hypothetical protein [Halobacillus sp. BBL2006]|uniref:hypothetical protein n=1 Tax=Halobacillus sp. BBL2006 TaxID=1543706 RepID=UPI000542E5DD|nr:hypothetical protein [Halobacillus sp. BBL2006]KHE71471.1 hypothetical protein LD39_09665 [Halobacillus sp. BBL2006]